MRLYCKTALPCKENEKKTLHENIKTTFFDHHHFIILFTVALFTADRMFQLMSGFEIAVGHQTSCLT